MHYTIILNKTVFEVTEIFLEWWAAISRKHPCQTIPFDFQTISEHFKVNG